MGNLASVMKQIERLLAGIPYSNLPRNQKGQNLATPFAADPRPVHLIRGSFNERKRNIEAWRVEVLVFRKTVLGSR